MDRSASVVLYPSASVDGLELEVLEVDIVVQSR